MVKECGINNSTLESGGTNPVPAKRSMEKWKLQFILAYLVRVVGVDLQRENRIAFRLDLRVTNRGAAACSLWQTGDARC